VKTVPVEKANLQTCVTNAQSDHIVLTKDGAPVAVLIGVEGLDREQIALGTSASFWKFISQRRKEPTISRAALDRKLNGRASRRRKS
jgi:antitoxin (DNA-binding transcriptional repressor) of toxin-antitoxin stability system